MDDFSLYTTHVKILRTFLPFEKIGMHYVHESRFNFIPTFKLLISFALIEKILHLKAFLDVYFIFYRVSPKRY